MHINVSRFGKFLISMVSMHVLPNARCDSSTVKNRIFGTQYADVSPLLCGHFPMHVTLPFSIPDLVNSRVDIPGC